MNFKDSSLTAPHIHHLDSDFLKRRRKLRVWHSPGASDDTPRHVLFQQDGQMAFSDRDDEVPFGTWGLDRHLERLCASGSLPPILVVGIDNSPKRRTEYFPVTDDYKDYERFLVEELAPWVQDKFPTLPGISLMGSSLGGIVSFALSANNPKLFPACACLSPWFEYEDFRYIREHLQHLRHKPPIRVYMDSGIRDWRGLDDGHRGMLMARIELLRLGFTEGDDLDRSEERRVGKECW